MWLAAAYGQLKVSGSSSRACRPNIHVMKARAIDRKDLADCVSNATGISCVLL
jgi:hypothetical protein